MLMMYLQSGRRVSIYTLAAIFMIYFRTGKWNAGAITNGFLTGLVGMSTPPSRHKHQLHPLAQS